MGNRKGREGGGEHAEAAGTMIILELGVHFTRGSEKPCGEHDGWQMLQCMRRNEEHEHVWA